MKQKASETLQTQSEYAKRRGVTRQYICRLVKSGVVVMRGKLIAAELSDAVLDDKSLVAPLRADDAPETAGSGSSYSDARRDREIYSARLRRLEYETKAGELIPSAAVTEKWTGIARVVKGKLEGLPARLAPGLAALADVRQVREMLSKEIAGVLREISQEVRYGGGK